MSSPVSQQVEAANSTKTPSVDEPSIHEIHLDHFAGAPQTEKEPRYSKIAKRLLPHVGLFSLLVAYLLIGAAVIHKIEGASEPVQRDIELCKIFSLRDEFRSRMWNITQKYFEKLTKSVLQSSRNHLINENHLTINKKEGEQLWTFTNSIFFATTVITTIGYGSLVPVTTLGRIATIIFALCGIPLIRVVTEEIGKFVFWKLFCYLHLRCRALRQKLKLFQSRPTTQENIGNPIEADDELWPEDDFNGPVSVFMVLPVLLAYTALGGFLFQFWQGSNYFEALFSCFNAMTTIGSTDTVPSTLLPMVFTITYITFGLSLATICINMTKQAVSDGLYRFFHKTMMKPLESEESWEARGSKILRKVMATETKLRQNTNNI